MGVTFTAYLACDDNSSADEPPFTNDPSVWSLTSDFGLSACGEYGFFAALGYRDSRHPGFSDPLVPLRKVPVFQSGRTYYEMDLWVEDDYVGWLSAKEVFASLEHHSIVEEELVRSVRVLLGTIRYLSSVYGEERVRLIFEFCP